MGFLNAESELHPTPPVGLSPAARWSIGGAIGVAVVLALFVAVAARAPRAAPALNLPSEHRTSAPVATKDEPLPARIWTPPPEAKPEIKRWDTLAPAETHQPDEAISGRHNVAILSRYEQGNVDAALQIALNEDDAALATRLQQFSKLYRAGKDAMSAHDNARALRNFTAALAIDRQLARGRWGRYGPELRALVNQLHPHKAQGRP